MNEFRPHPSPYSATQQGRKIFFENEYTRWEHDLDQGGELCGAIVKNGSGKNFISAPQALIISTLENKSFHEFSSARCKVQNWKLEGQRLVLDQVLVDAKDQVLPGVTVEHTVEYHPWGYGQHTIQLHLEKRIDEIGQLQIGSFGLAPICDYLGYRADQIESPQPWCGSPIEWKKLTAGESSLDSPAVLRRYLPLQYTFLKRGVEALEMTRGDDLQSWECNGTISKYRQVAYIDFRAASNDYEVRMSAYDSDLPGQYLEGDHTFTFSMSMPFVKKNILPLRLAGSLLLGGRGFENRWPTAEDLESWKAQGISLLRLHNDGDGYKNGIFWRDAAYPPYPEEEMAKMEVSLKAAATAGIGVVPYFSVKEFHPEAADYTDNAEAWARRTEPGSPVQLNHTRHGVFGAQMCLETDWIKKREDTIDQVLTNHDFSGMYYDWCHGSGCYHGGKSHWDGDKLQEFLEWTRRRAGEDGETWVHVTNVPTLRGENLATLVLMEEKGYGKITPEMFTPQVHFLNVAPRQICDMLPGNASVADRKRLAYCAILHHVSISSTNSTYLEAYQQMRQIPFHNYTRHTAPGEGIASTDCKNVGISAYWNEKSALICLANLAEEPQKCRWQADLLGGISGEIELQPLELKLIEKN